MHNYDKLTYLAICAGTRQSLYFDNLKSEDHLPYSSTLNLYALRIAMVCEINARKEKK